MFSGYAKFPSSEMSLVMKVMQELFFGILLKVELPSDVNKILCLDIFDEFDNFMVYELVQSMLVSI